jgi:predicted ATP-dependent endonuclease of OLD family
MKKKGVLIRIGKISIANYKGIDEIEVEFPKPQLLDDPNILVIGSQNGLGKTSIIECCSLLLLAFHSNETFENRYVSDKYSSVDIPDLLIRAGANSLVIKGEIYFDGKHNVKIEIKRDGRILVDGSIESKQKKSQAGRFREIPENLISAISGFTPNPVIEDSFLLFHSYRKVQEGKPELGMMVERELPGRRVPFSLRHEFPMSTFKLKILRLLMSKAGLFESVAEQESEDTINELNKLIGYYAGGTISKLRPSPDNTVDFRIESSSSGNTFTFDGLSSGQKEIISTLFLIKYYTKNNSRIVLIDEPELHLNAQWHRSFINSLIEIAPENQYIIATHSEDIMDSVPEANRILLVRSEESKND